MSKCVFVGKASPIAYSYINLSITRLVSMARLLKTTVVGSGNWGTAAAKVISQNVQVKTGFDPTVRMYVLEEVVNGQKLTEIINTKHENVKYLPGITLPSNLIAIPDLKEAITDADLLIFVVPHQFIKSVVSNVKATNAVKPGAIGISLIKGIDIKDQAPVLNTKIINDELGVDCSILSGANVAFNVAKEEFCEATVGYNVKENAKVWQKLFDAPYFKIRCIPDVAGVELCGAIKNVVAIAAGFCDGLDVGSNTKAAVMRMGLLEMKAFALKFFPTVLDATFFESAGVADLITTCFGGRNVKCAAEFARHDGNKAWNDIEAELLNGQKLQGVLSAEQIYDILKLNNLEHEFPIFAQTYLVSFGKKKPNKFIKNLHNDKLAEF